MSPASIPERVFLSYHRDTPAAKALAERLYEALRTRKCAPFLDHLSIQAGDDWAQRIYSELFDCDAAIILLSRSGLEKSAWLAHEAAILAGRRGRWRDIVLVPVLLDLAPTDVTQEGRFSALQQVMFFDARGLDIDGIVERIIDHLKARSARVASRLWRTTFYRALLGVPHRARAFQASIAERLPGSDVELRSALARARLPAPPTDVRVDLRWYLAGLLLSVDDPGPILDALPPYQAETLRRFLGRRWLLPHSDRLSWSLTTSFFWSLRRSVWVGQGVGLFASVGLVSLATSKWGYVKPGAFWRAMSIATPIVTFIVLGLVVAIRLATFVRSKLRV